MRYCCSLDDEETETTKAEGGDRTVRHHHHRHLHLLSRNRTTMHDLKRDGPAEVESWDASEDCSTLVQDEVDPFHDRHCHPPPPPPQHRPLQQLRHYHHTRHPRCCSTHRHEESLLGPRTSWSNPIHCGQ